MPDWFPYFLHPERLQEEFGGNHDVSAAQRTAAVDVLRGLLGSSNFRAHILSSYPSLRQPANHHDQAQYTGPTPPSTPRMQPADALGAGDPAAAVHSVRRVGQCTYFTMDAQGMPNETLSQALQTHAHGELTARQLRLLDVAAALDALVHFRVEEIESAVHATLRFMFFLHVLAQPHAQSAANTVAQYRRWTVRAAYREEEIGLTLSVDTQSAPGLAANAKALEQYAASEGCAVVAGERFAVAYDLARLALAQGRYARALELFAECQALDADKCRAQRFVVGAAQPSVDEYAAACGVIVDGGHDGVEMNVPDDAAATPTGQFGGLRISPPGEGQALLGFQENDNACSYLSPLVEDAGGGFATLAEDAQHARDALAADASGPAAAVAVVRAAHAYVAGLRQLERMQHASAHTWFANGANILDAADAAGDAAERDRAVRSVLQVQLQAHAQLAAALGALKRGDGQDAWAGIDAVAGAQVAVRFEFLEPAIVAGLRPDCRAQFARLVAAVGTQPKLYQQLPDVHMALLQAVSLLAVVRDALTDMHVDLDALLLLPSADAPGVNETDDEGTKAAEARLKDTVAEIARLAVRIPHAEISRLCRALADPPLLALLGAVLTTTAEHVSGDAPLPPGPWALSTLAHRLASDALSGDATATSSQRTHASRHLHGTSLAMLRSASVSRPATPCVLLALSQAARASGEDVLAARALVECVCHASSLDPLALDECVRAQWFASRAEGFSRALRSLGCGGGAAVVLQVAGAQRAVPAVAEAFGRGEVDARVARMLWDPSVVEYAEYLARARGRKGFVAYSEAAADARPLMLAAFFTWLAAELEPVP